MTRRWLALLAACGCVGANHHGFGDGVEAQAIDWSVDPCQDFYQFACGNWQRWHDAYPDTPQRTRAIDRETEVQAMFDIVSSAAAPKGPPATDRNQALVAGYYDQCQASSLFSNGTAIGDELAAIDGIVTPQDLARALAGLHADGISALFSLSVDADLAHADVNVLHLHLGGWSLPDRTQYTDPRFAAVRASYRAHVEALAGLFASGLSFTHATADPVLAIETTLTLGSPSKEESEQPESALRPITRADLLAGTPSFPWDDYLGAAAVGPFTTLNLDDAAALSTLDTVFKAAALDELKAYLRWRVFEAHGWAADPQTAAEEFAFHRHLLEGVAVEDDRYWECFLDTTSWMSPALAPIYVARRFSPEARAEATRLIESIRTAMAERIRTRPWLDDPTRQEALQKLGQVVARIGFPDTWPPVDALQVDGTSFVGDRITIARRLRQQNLAALGTPVDRQRFALSPLEINAAYVPELNQIVFPAAILQQPYFALGRPAAVNLGAIGMVMGHELTHGFDNFGRHFDGQGGLRDWWTPGVAAEFGRRAQCLVDEYGAFQVPSGAHVDGAFTLPENIADLGGVLLAHDAWMSLGEPEGNDSWITRSQQFFVAFAQSWCELTRDQTADLLVLADPHAPGRFRVNGTLANVPAFAAAFACPTGAALAPANRCELW